MNISIMMSIQKDGASAFLVGLRTSGWWLIFEPTVPRSRPKWISRVRKTVQAPFQVVAPSLCPAEIACLLMTSSFCAYRYSEVTRQVSLPSSHRSRSSHQTLSRTSSFFIEFTFFAVQLFAQPMRSSWSNGAVSLDLSLQLRLEVGGAATAGTTAT